MSRRFAFTALAAVLCGASSATLQAGEPAGSDWKNDFRTPVIGPIVSRPTTPCEEPPDEAVVLRGLSRVRSVPGVYELFRDDITIVPERLVDRVDAPRFFPLVGVAQLHHCHWKCSVYSTETIAANYPFPLRTQLPHVEIVYVDTDHLHLMNDKATPSAEEVPSRSLYEEE